MNCAKCGQAVPEGAMYCPFCTAGQGGERDVLRGGLRGALIGFLVGIVPALALLYFYGPERGIKAIAFALPLGTLTTGLILGLVRSKTDWK